MRRVGVLVLIACGPAHAHVERDMATGLLAGIMHPVSGPDHVLAMVCVGLWGAQLGAPALWMLPVVFPLVMACGGFLGLVGVPLPGAEVAIAMSAVTLGLCVARELHVGGVVASILVGTFAVFHGYAHGSELPGGQNPLLYSVGFVAATGFLHGLGIGLGLLRRWPIGRGLVRMMGGCIAAAGALFLWRAGS
jgi:urease accessory protein